MFTDIPPNAVLLLLFALGAAVLVLAAVVTRAESRTATRAALAAGLVSDAPQTGGDETATGRGQRNIVDIQSEIRTIMARVAPRVRRQFSQVTTAIQPGLVAASEPAAFRQALTDLFDAALQRAPCGQIIVTAGRQGPRVAITVSDDGMVAGLHATESVLRGASQLIAMQGGTLDIDMRPGEGTITTISLSAPAPAVSCLTDDKPSETILNMDTAVA